MNIKVPQVEYISGTTPQESAQMLNARIRELGHSNPTFQRDGIGFWITYDVSLDDEPKTPRQKFPGEGVCCSFCPCFEHVSDRAKWGRCQKHGGASVSGHKKVCDTYWILIEGGGEFNA